MLRNLTRNIKPSTMYYLPNHKDNFSISRRNDVMRDKQCRRKWHAQSHHQYEFTQEDIASIFCKQIYIEIINTKAFQRLKNIHFLGSIDYAIDKDGPKPNKRHTRYQHSLGVAQLALQYAEERELSYKEEILCVVAALLHDIGHAPLSHTLESVFKEQYGIAHHISSEKIIKGQVPIGSGLHKVLWKWGISPCEIIDIINGTRDQPSREIFGGAINIDTIEAILRSSTYVYQNPLFSPPSKVLEALLLRDEKGTGILDNFWLLKNEIYEKLINHRVGILTDYLCQKYMRDHADNFSEEFYFSTEQELERIHPLLFSQLKKVAKENPAGYLYGINEIRYINRTFYINKGIQLDSIDSVNLRYTQERSTRLLNLRNRSGKSVRHKSKGRSLHLF